MNNPKVESNGEPIARRLLPLVATVLLISGIWCWSDSFGRSRVEQYEVVCGFNQQAPSTIEELMRSYISSGSEWAEIDIDWITSSILDIYWDGTGYDDCRRHPMAFDISNEENAMIFAGPSGWHGMLVDVDWLRDLCRKTGDAWTYVAVIAHELGHQRNGHICSPRNQCVVDDEKEADIFTGRALAKLGASLSSAQKVFRKISSYGREYCNQHPPLDVRLAAIEVGWREGREHLKRLYDPPPKTYDSKHILLRVSHGYGVSAYNIFVNGKLFVPEFTHSALAIMVPLPGSTADIRVEYEGSTYTAPQRGKTYKVEAGEFYKVDKNLELSIP